MLFPGKSLIQAKGNNQVASGNFHSLWVYLIAPIVGSAIAVPLWTITRGSGSGDTEN